MESISSWDTGVLLGWSEAFPATDMLVGDLEKNVRGASSAAEVFWCWEFWDVEPAEQKEPSLLDQESVQAIKHIIQIKAKSII